MDQRWQPIVRPEFSTTTVARIFSSFQSTSGAVDRRNLVYLGSFLIGSFLLKATDFSAFQIKSDLYIQSISFCQSSYYRKVK